MAKWLIFIYRYITAPYRLRKWFNVQTAVVFILSAVFFSALAWTSPANRPYFLQGSEPANSTPTPTLSDSPPREATLSPEFLANSEQAVGISLIGAALVLIVVLGVLIFLPRHDE